MSIERVREYFSAYHMDGKIQEFEVSSAAVELAAKAKMIPPEEVTDLIGYAVGGVCPFAVGEGVEVYLDVSLRRFETVFPACGSANSAIELAIQELEKYSGYAGWVDVCKVIKGEAL